MKLISKIIFNAATYVAIILGFANISFASDISVNVSASSVSVSYAGSASNGSLKLTLSMPDGTVSTERGSLNDLLSIDLSGDGNYRYTAISVDKSADNEDNFVASKEQDSFEIFNGGVVTDPVATSDELGHKQYIPSFLESTLISVVNFIIPAASAVDLEAEDDTPDVRWDDDGDGNNVEWLLRGQLESASAVSFRLFDREHDNDLPANSIIDINSIGNSEQSLVIETDGNMSFANESVFVDRLISVGFTTIIGGGGFPILVPAFGPAIGIGTITPTEQLHIASVGPAILLEDTNADEWAIEAGSTFTITNRTDSVTPFSISDDGVRLNEGIDATSAPDDTLVVGGELTVSGEFNGAGNPKLMVEDTSATFGPKRLLELRNNGEPQLRFTNTAISSAQGWVLNSNGINNFKIDRTDGPGTDVLVDQNGSMTVRGTVRANGVLLTSASSTKTDFKEINEVDILDKLTSLEVKQWRYKEGPVRTHIGPMAEDFHSAFGLGTDKQIDLIDMNGVLVASNQALNAKVEQQATYIKDLEDRLSAVESNQARLNDLEELVVRLVNEKDSPATLSKVSY